MVLRQRSPPITDQHICVIVGRMKLGDSKVLHNNNTPDISNLALIAQKHGSSYFKVAGA